MRAAELPRDPLSDTLASVAGATRLASRTITNAIPPKSTIATAAPMNSSEPELDVLLDVVAGVVAAFAVVLSGSLLVSSLNELPSPRFAGHAGCGSSQDDPSASEAHAMSSSATRLDTPVCLLRRATARGYRRGMRAQAGWPALARQTLE